MTELIGNGGLWRNWLEMVGCDRTDWKLWVENELNLKDDESAMNFEMADRKSIAVIVNLCRKWTMIVDGGLEMNRSFIAF